MGTTEIESGRGAEAQEFYVWEPPGKQISIRLSFDVIDQILQESLQGLGAVPRRGVEVGGVLLGTARPGEPRVITIDDFSLVKCEYASGPSYCLSDSDKRRLEGALRKWPKGPERPVYVVGYFRSHTRKDLFLSDEDLALCSQYFSTPADVVLLIRPFVTRTSQAGFFFWENGAIAREATALEFPFSRKELGGGESPVRRRRDSTGEESVPESAAPEPAAPVRVPQFLMPETRRPPGMGKWAILALIFLMLGALLGFVATPYVRIHLPGPVAEDPYSFGLAAADDGDHLHIKWNRQAPAILAAKGGRITIVDNGSARVLELDLHQLQNGTVIYKRMGARVDVKMEAFIGDHGAVAENVEVKTQ